MVCHRVGKEVLMREMSVKRKLIIVYEMGNGARERMKAGRDGRCGQCEFKRQGKEVENGRKVVLSKRRRRIEGARQMGR